jgi:hypothetical protein
MPTTDRGASATTAANIARRRTLRHLHGRAIAATCAVAPPLTDVARAELEQALRDVPRRRIDVAQAG